MENDQDLTEIIFVATISEAQAKNISDTFINSVKTGLRGEDKKNYKISRTDKNGLAVYTKNAKGEEILSFEFMKTDDGAIYGIKLNPKDIFVNSVFNSIELSDNFVKGLNDVKKEIGYLPPNIPMTTSPSPDDDLIKLYKEIYKIIEDAYLESQRTGKKLAVVLPDKHNNEYEEGILSHMTIESDENLYKVVQVMALNAFHKITGSDDFLLEWPTTNIKTVEDMFKKRELLIGEHQEELVGYAKKYGLKTTAGDPYWERHPEISEQDISSPEIVKLRDKEIVPNYNKKKDHFIAMNGMVHVISLMGADMDEIIRSDGNIVPDPQKAICGDTHKVIYILPEVERFIKNNGINYKCMDFVAKNSIIPKVCDNWDLREFSGKDDFSLNVYLNRAIQFADMEKATKAEQNKFSQLSRLAAENNNGYDFALMGNLTAVADIFSKDGDQLDSDEYKKAVELLATAFEESCKIYGKDKTPAEIKKTTDKMKGIY